MELSGPVGPFEDVFLIPILTHNLISVRDLNDMGIKITFADGTMIMEYHDVILMSTKSIDGAWSCDFMDLCDKILAVMPEETKKKCWWLYDGIIHIIIMFCTDHSHRVSKK